MLIFTLVISFLTTSSLPWLMDLTFQVCMQYCSLQPRAFLSPPDTPTTEHHFHFGPAASFFLDLLVIALSSSPVAYWIPSDLGGLIFWCHIFLPFHTVHGILVARILERIAIPSSSGSRFVRTLHCDLSILVCPCMAWLIASLSYISPFTMTRLWSMEGPFWISSNNLLVDPITVHFRVNFIHLVFFVSLYPGVAEPNICVCDSLIWDLVRKSEHVCSEKELIQ